MQRKEGSDPDLNPIRIENLAENRSFLGRVFPVTVFLLVVVGRVLFISCLPVGHYVAHFLAVRLVIEQSPSCNGWNGQEQYKNLAHNNIPKELSLVSDSLSGFWFWRDTLTHGGYK